MTSPLKGDNGKQSSMDEEISKGKTGRTTIQELKESLHDRDHPVGHLYMIVSDVCSDGSRLIQKCNKPNFEEFRLLAYVCSVGFIIMGFIGYLVKLLFIPINNIIIGRG